MMVKLLFYAYCVGLASSRRIERKTYEDVAFCLIFRYKVTEQIALS
jgi:hypothetical protein